MIPQFLYKYRRWDCDNHKRLLSNKEIYFSSARSFNDPFDTYVHLNYQTGTEEQFRALSRKVLRSEFPKLTDSEMEEQVQIRIKSGIFQEPEVFEKWEKDLGEDKLNRFGIFTMSAVMNNILLWSHYADSHKGFCVEFHTGKLDSYFEEMAENKELTIDLYRVGYFREYPDFNGHEIKKDEDAVMCQLVSKTLDWAYEEEFRAICLDGVNFPLTLDTGIITKVILGCRMPDDHKNQIIDILTKSGNNIQLVQAKRKRRSFILEFERINYVDR